MSSWFNRGFLVLRSIDWSTPAIVLEKIIRYEAVHEIRDFPSLRLRIDPPDRRCYGFFHPALPDEPLIFVEVALTDAIPAAIGPLLDADRKPVTPDKAKVAVFYSISNCQKGLAGISFGNFLIKQVVQELRRDFPRIETFVTLSPVPASRAGSAASISRRFRSKTASCSPSSRRRPGAWRRRAGADAQARRAARRRLFPHCQAVRRAPADPVANFHLGNGARLERLGLAGGHLREGDARFGRAEVNYLYDLDDIERNHEAFANQAEIVAASAVRKLLRPEAKATEPAR